MPEFASVEQIRRRFPALSRTHNGHAVALFDGPGRDAGPAPGGDAMTRIPAPPQREHRLGVFDQPETDQALFEARGALADWIGGSRRRLCSRQHDHTHAPSRPCTRTRMARGGCGVVHGARTTTRLRHLRALVKERGVDVRTIRMRREDGCLDEEDVARKLTPGTRLLAVGAAPTRSVPLMMWRGSSNWRMRWVRWRSSTVHYASHHMADVRAWNCDFFCLLAYKFYGRMSGCCGATPSCSRNWTHRRLEPAPIAGPGSLETGTHEPRRHRGGSRGGRLSRLPAVVTCHVASGSAACSQCLQQPGAVLLRQLWMGCRAIPGVELYGCRRAATARPRCRSRLAGRDAGDVATALAARAYSCRTVTSTRHCCRVLGHERDGLVRRRAALRTRPGGVERLVEGVRGLV